MRPDVHGLATAIALVLLLTLLLPKRGWWTIPARLRLVAGGERAQVFGPPVRSPKLAAGAAGRVVQALLAELPRAFEMGVPLYLAATRAEALGAARRAASEQEWRESWAGLLLRHLGGELTEEDLRRRLRERNLPPPAAALSWTPPRPYTMPPMRWRLDWDRRLGELQHEAGAAEVGEQPQAAGTPAAEAEPAPAVATTSRVEIQTLGEIRVSLGGMDIAAALLHRPAVACTFLYLVAREVRRPGDRITRAVLADELFPGAVRDKRHKLSRRLSALRTQDLPGPLGKRIRIDGEYVSIDLSDCAIDVRSVLDLATEIAPAGASMREDTRAAAENALRQTTAEFLPGWEEIELRGTGGGSGMTAVIEEVRDQIADARLSILDALASLRVAQGRPDEAVPHLEEALRCRPERISLARRLADVYELTGRRQRAAAIRQEYGIDAAS